jgi:TetR/AcrR family transcriptional repressor of bet genes
VGRPPLAETRRRQILEAAIRCLSNRGLAASTLDAIAAEAGMARGHVRHFVGNRDEILTAAAVLFYFGAVPEHGGEPISAHGGSFLPAGTTTIAEALDYLFGGFAEPGPENLAALAFVDAARTNERIRTVVVHAYLSSESELGDLLSQAAPQASLEQRASAAYGILTIALGNVFMSDIEVSHERTARARRSAELLVNEVMR